MVPSSMKRYRLYLCGGLGAASITLGTLLLCSYLNIIRHILYQKLRMTEGSETFQIWRDTPVPQTMSFYLYNWTNPEDVRDLTTKPKLTQMGPYVFKVIEKKTNITWNNNGTITFKIQRTWFYDAENSDGSLDDEITTLNSVALSAANTVRHKDLFLRKGLSTSLWATHQKVYVRTTIGELLFFGYSDPLLDMAKQLPAFDGIEIPPFDKFGWFYMRNGSDSFEGTFEMDRGLTDIFSFGILRNWNFRNQTNFYPTPCGLVNGSAGELFPPERTKSKLEMFSADLCRSISLQYRGEEEVMGVVGYRYEGDEYTFDNGTLDSANECFCGGECSPAGVLNVTTCRFGAPGFVSFPNFYLADKFYEDQVEGIHVKPHAHKLYITLEPNTGIPLDVAARFQINMLLSPVPGITLFEEVPKIYFPAIWFEQKATITEELAWQVRLVLMLPLLMQSLGALLVSVGAVLFFITICVSLRSTDRDQKDDLKLTGGTIEPLIDTKNSKGIINQKQTLITQT